MRAAATDECRSVEFSAQNRPTFDTHMFGCKISQNSVRLTLGRSLVTSVCGRCILRPTRAVPKARVGTIVTYMCSRESEFNICADHSWRCVSLLRSCL